MAETTQDDNETLIERLKYVSSRLGEEWWAGSLEGTVDEAIAALTLALPDAAPGEGRCRVILPNGKPCRCDVAPDPHAVAEKDAEIARLNVRLEHCHNLLADAHGCINPEEYKETADHIIKELGMVPGGDCDLPHCGRVRHLLAFDQAMTPFRWTVLRHALTALKRVHVDADVRECCSAILASVEVLQQ